MQTAHVNGIDIAYRVDGETSKPWMVLSNSLATDHRMWDPQVSALTATHRVLRYDTRGHGQSQASAGDYSFDMLVADAVGLMDDLGIAKADVMGLSLGGMTALGMALDHPDRVNRIICCDARAEAPAPYAEFWRDRISVARTDGLPALVDGTLERWFAKEVRTNPTISASIDLAQDMIVSTSVDGFCGCATALTQLNYGPRLGSISAPVLCLVGDQDQAAPPDTMRDMANTIPAGEFVELADAAHLSNLNQPAAFNRAVCDWLSSGDAAS